MTLDRRDFLKKAGRAAVAGTIGASLTGCDDWTPEERFPDPTEGIKYALAHEEVPLTKLYEDAQAFQAMSERKARTVTNHDQWGFVAQDLLQSIARYDMVFEQSETGPEKDDSLEKLMDMYLDPILETLSDQYEIKMGEHILRVEKAIVGSMSGTRADSQYQVRVFNAQTEEEVKLPGRNPLIDGAKSLNTENQNWTLRTIMYGDG